MKIKRILIIEWMKKLNKMKIKNNKVKMKMKMRKMIQNFSKKILNLVKL